jgi:hypothetical protein
VAGIFAPTRKIISCLYRSDKWPVKIPASGLTEGFWANVSLQNKTDAVFVRREVLKRNPNLARRALFGVVMRTEILNFLLQKGSSFPAEISKTLGYRYHRVISDIQGLVRDGAIIDSFAGKNGR